MSPLQAQEELSALIGKFDFQSSHKEYWKWVFCPAIQWKSTYDFLDIVCVRLATLAMIHRTNTLVP